MSDNSTPKINIIRGGRTSENTELNSDVTGPTGAGANVNETITPSLTPSLTPSMTPSMTPSQQIDNGKIHVKWEDLGLPDHLRGRFDELDVDHSGTLEISEIADLIMKYDNDLMELADDHQEIKKDRQIISRQHIVILKNQAKLDDQQNAHQKLLLQMAAAQKERSELLAKVDHASHRALNGQRKLMVSYLLLTCFVALIIALFIHLSKEVDADSDGTLKTVDGTTAKTANTDFSVGTGDVLGGPVLKSRSTGENLKTEGLSHSFNLTKITTDERLRHLQEFHTTLSRQLADSDSELLIVEVECESVMAAAAACRYNGEACGGRSPCATPNCGIYVIEHLTEHMHFPSGSCKAGDSESQCYESLVNAACGPSADTSVALDVRVAQHKVFPEGTVLNLVCKGQCGIYQDPARGRRRNLQSATKSSSLSKRHLQNKVIC